MPPSGIGRSPDSRRLSVYSGKKCCKTPRYLRSSTAPSLPVSHFPQTCHIDSSRQDHRLRTHSCPGAALLRLLPAVSHPPLPRSGSAHKWADGRSRCFFHYQQEYPVTAEVFLLRSPPALSGSFLRFPALFCSSSYAFHLYPIPHTVSTGESPSFRNFARMFLTCSVTAESSPALSYPYTCS